MSELVKLTFDVDVEALAVKGFSQLGHFSGSHDLEVLAGVESGQVAAGLAQDEGRALSQAGLHLAARSVRFDGVKKLENVCANEDLGSKLPYPKQLEGNGVMDSALACCTGGLGSIPAVRIVGLSYNIQIFSPSPV